MKALSAAIVTLSIPFLFPFEKRNMHHICKTLANLLADVLSNADVVAGRPHLHNLAFVEHNDEGGVDVQTTLALMSNGTSM